MPRKPRDLVDGGYYLIPEGIIDYLYLALIATPPMFHSYDVLTCWSWFGYEETMVLI
ncbi:MAG: hypothetical protein KAR20_00760 [Candidatus Heimdallarchaeota archaeon]|nr:hypothetical protein [Candidatus Heimdallarchaeota archaeon]